MQAMDTAVVRAVTVRATPEQAFSAFTEGMSAWWPLDTHKIGQAAAVAAVVQPREGGRWFERDEDGSETAWGRVLAYEAPSRIALAWQLTCDWGYDPDFVTELEVRFTPEGDARTRVELEHRNLDRYGDKADEMRASLGGEGGWPYLLQRFADSVGA